MNQFSYKPVIFCAITMAFALTAAGSVLPPAYFEVDMQAGYTPDNAVGLYSAGYYTPGDYGLGSGTASLSAIPSLTEQVSIGGVASVNNYAYYYFSVLGPATGEIIPLLVSGSLSASAAGDNASAGTQLRIDTSVDEAILGVNSGEPSWSGILHVNYQEGSSPGIVQMLASAGNADTDGSASAFAGNPYISIDPTFADASEYSVIVSDEVGNGSGAPEPGSFSLLGIAIVTAGLVQRSKRRTTHGN